MEGPANTPEFAKRTSAPAESEPKLAGPAPGPLNELPDANGSQSKRPRRNGAGKRAKEQDELPAAKSVGPTLATGDGAAPAKPKRGRQGAGGGPRTKAGKARSSRNAVKHGIYSPVTAIPGMESLAERTRHREGLFDYYQPQGYGEELLVSRLDSLSWRMMRAERHETAVVARQVVDREPALALDEAYARALEADAFTDAYGDDDDDDDDDSPQSRALEQLHLSLLREASLIPYDNARESSMRYESHLHRQFMQTLHELEALQDRRDGRPSYLGRFDTTGPPKA